MPVLRIMRLEDEKVPQGHFKEGTHEIEFESKATIKQKYLQISHQSDPLSESLVILFTFPQTFIYFLVNTMISHKFQK